MSSHRYRALLIEDNPGDVRLVKEMLAAEERMRLDLECASTLKEGLRRLEGNSLDAVLVDLGLPDSHGLETFVRLHEKFPRMPTIVLTGNNDVGLAIRAVQAGAQDYLIKAEIAPSPLLRAVQYAIERKRNEEELLRLQEQLATDLQKEVDERTAELRKRTEALEAATRKLEETNRDLEAFTYSVSHDLRAPLRTIDGFSRLLVETYEKELNPTAADYLARVRKAAGRMSELINDMLSLSRVGRQEMRIAEVDLTALVRRICEELRQRDPARAVEFVVAPDVSARGDAALLRILLENLLDNAWKFTSRHATAKIEFGVYGDERDRTYFVRDDGAGFDPQYKDKLFVPFQRLHTVTEFEGTGIGLATVQRIVKRHGGTLNVESAVERGASFFFTLEPSREGDGA